MKKSYQRKSARASGEVGYWAVPKEVMYRKDLSIEARVVYGVLWTRQNGDNVAWPGQAYIADKIGVSDRSIRRYVTELKEAGLIEVEQQGLRKTNRYFLTGQVDRSRADTPDRSHSKNPDVRTQMKGHLAAGAAGKRKDQDIVDVFEAFQKSGLNPMIQYGNLTQRKAAKDLIGKYGKEKVIATVNFAGSIMGEPYAPTVTTPVQLRDKLGAIVAFAKKRDTLNKKTGILIIS